METDTLDYALTTILSIVNKDNEVHPVAFHFCTVAELNYNTHDKELLVIFEAFIFLLPRYWPRGKHSGPSTSSSSTLSSGSTLVVLAPNRMLLLDNGMSILKREILATPQSTLTTSNLSSLKNNLQSPYKLWFFFLLLSMQLQSWIWTPYIEISSQLSLVTQLLQNTPPQMASGLWTQTAYSSLTTEFIYHLLAFSIHVFSSTIMITYLLDILVKTKYWN